MRVSFDFDSTLDRKIVQEYAKKLINLGLEVWIVTSRYENIDQYNFKCDNSDLFEVAKKVGISESNIYFTNFEDKVGFFQTRTNHDFIFHLDDDWIELNLINRDSHCNGISCFGNSTWERKCNKLLAKKGVKIE